jgi:GNAT superfamily N-acetyltransferase
VASAADVPLIAEFYSELSADSFRRRFHSGRPKPPLLARLAWIDVAPGSVSLLAEAESRLVAEARYVPMAEDVAELALAVLDDFQGLGLGRLLLSTLVDHANATGLERLSAVVNLTNDTMLHLLIRHGTALTELADEGVVCLEISAAGGMPGWPRTSAGRRILVERRGWFANRQVAALRAAGHHVRQCAGPGPEHACPLVEEGRCRLAEGADRIVSLLPADDPDCAAVTAAHQRLWPGKVAR